MSYSFQSGFSRAAIGYADFVTALGTAMILPAGAAGVQLDSAHGYADQDPGIGSRLRLSVFSGAVSPEGLVAWANALPLLFATINYGGAPTDPYTLALAADVAAGGLTVRFDQMANGYEKDWPFSSRPGAGLVIPPGENAIVLLTPTLYSGGTPSGTPIQVILTVCGSPLTAAELSPGAPLGFAMARAGNILQPGK